MNEIWTIQTAEQKPFHESIVDQLNEMNNDGSLVRNSHIAIYAGIILRTKIPENHDAIIEAWKAALQRVGHKDTGSVLGKLTTEKQIAEVRRKKKDDGGSEH